MNIIIFRGGYRISEKGGGGSVSVLTTKTRCFRAHTRDVFSPLYEVLGSPKRGRGVLTTGTPPPPWTRP